MSDAVAWQACGNFFIAGGRVAGLIDTVLLRLIGG
jgi:hypothetical protein